jgi:hypothetical protein
MRPRFGSSLSTKQSQGKLNDALKQHVGWRWLF